MMNKLLILVMILFGYSNVNAQEEQPMWFDVYAQQEYYKTYGNGSDDVWSEVSASSSPQDFNTNYGGTAAQWNQVHQSNKMAAARWNKMTLVQKGDAAHAAQQAVSQRAQQKARQYFQQNPQ